MSTNANSTQSSDTSGSTSELKQPDISTMNNAMRLYGFGKTVDALDFASPSKVFDAAIALLKGLDALKTVQPEDFVNFGQRTSHTYRRDFMKKTEKLSNDARIGIIFLFTAVKNKNRVLSESKNLSPVIYPWLKEAVTFISTSMVQYVTELERQPNAFAGVHVPHILPTVTTICWITQNSTMTAAHYIENLWACQMKLPKELKMLQYEWEKNFWDNTVTTTRNKDIQSFQKGFQEQFWNTKAADAYPFITYDCREVVINDIETLDTYLGMMKIYAPNSNLHEGYILSPERIYEYARLYKKIKAEKLPEDSVESLFADYLTKPSNPLIRFEVFAANKANSEAKKLLAEIKAEKAKGADASE